MSIGLGKKRVSLAKRTKKIIIKKKGKMGKE
jgi:hypothetical protein